MTAVGRELLGFIWAIGIKAEAVCKQPTGGMTRTERTKAKTFQIRKKQKRIQPMNNVTPTRGQGQPQPEQARRRILGGSMRQASAGLARLVRGSSRRIMIMRFRPANISLINRRHYLPRLLLTLSSKRHMQKQKRPQRCADIDRVTPYHCRGRDDPSLIAPRTDPYERVYAYGSYEG